jgi:hypothetical protein
MAMQNVVVGQATEVNVPPELAASGNDHFPSSQK